MKLLIAIVLLSTTAPESTVKELRKHYALVGVNEGHVIEMFNLSKNADDPLVLAYAAGAEMASAQFKFSPIAKLSAFNSGKAKLEPIVIAHPEKTEIRFIRYTIQLKCPAFLGYNKALKTDRSFILNQMPILRQTDTELYKYILAFLLLHDKLSDEEKKSIGLN